LASEAGDITESQWANFLAASVTSRFPQGLTVWEANGQWRGPGGGITRERAKVLLLVHDGSPGVGAAVHELVEIYKRTFRQDSVLWENASVCATF